MGIWEIKLSALAICMILKTIGELWQHNAQRFVLPIELVASMLLIAILNNDSSIVLCLCSMVMIWPIDEGYKFYGPKDQVNRAAWLAAIGFVAWLVPTLTGHLDFHLLKIPLSGWLIFIPYVALCGFIGRIDRKWNNKIWAPINGMAIGLPILAFN